MSYSSSTINATNPLSPLSEGQQLVGATVQKIVEGTPFPLTSGDDEIVNLNLTSGTWSIVPIFQVTQQDAVTEFTSTNLSISFTGATVPFVSPVYYNNLNFGDGGVISICTTAILTIPNNTTFNPVTVTLTIEYENDTTAPEITFGAVTCTRLA
jgi:hypothetical protein